MDLSLTTRDEAGFTVVAPSGEVDVFTAPALDEALEPLTSQPSPQVIVDLTGVDFLDSSGLGVLVKALKRVRDHEGTLRLVVTSDRIAKVFKVTGLDAVIPLHATLADAVAAAQ